MKRIVNIKIILLIFLSMQATYNLSAQNPGKKWMRYKSPEDAGWSSKKLLTVCQNANASSAMLIHKGKVVFAYGEYCRRFKIHSVRKSLLSALYGIHVENGNINLYESLDELKVSDKTPLTNEEKKARIIDLLKCRSGVYLPAGQETEEMRKSRPKRGSHPHDTFWYYNNWDFNVLGTIFKQETKSDIFEEFYRKIAAPLQMEDFSVIDGTYDYELEYSNHPGYPFKMSARDLARFGQLYLQKGTWNGKQIISQDWIKQSITPWSKTDSKNLINDNDLMYGYLWWIDEDFHNKKMFFASGHGGQKICVVPELNIVLVIQADTYIDNSVFDADFVIDDLIINAKISEPVPHPEFVPLEEREKFNGGVLLSKQERNKFIGDYKIGDNTFSIKAMDKELVLDSYHYSYKFRLLPISKSEFYVEDIDLLLCFEFDENGVPVNPSFHKSEATAKLYDLIIDKGIEAAVKQFPMLKIQIRNKDELRYLAKKLEKLNIETLELKKLNAICFPDSYLVQSELKDELLKKHDIKSGAKVFAEIVDTLHKKGIKNSKAEWFSDIMNAFAFPAQLTETEKTKCIGDYSSMHIILENDILYYYRDNPNNKYKLYKIAHNLFAVENRFYFRIQFANDEYGNISKIIRYYYRDTHDEITKIK
jgi:CubicO group peptidase (beta-lactamase class C family)